MDNRDYYKLIAETYKQHRQEWLELKNGKWHWRAQPFSSFEAAKHAIDKALIGRSEPKGEMVMNFKKAI